MKIIPRQSIEDYLHRMLPEVQGYTSDPDNLRVTLRMFLRLPHFIPEDVAENDNVTYDGLATPEMDSLMRLKHGLARLRESTTEKQKEFFQWVFRHDWRTLLDFEHGILSTPWGVVTF